MKTLTPAMKTAISDATASDGMLRCHPRTIAALETRKLVKPFGNAGDYTLTDAGFTVGRQLATTATPVSLVERAEIAAAAHFANATSEDVERSFYTSATYKASDAALRAAIVAAYPGVNVDQVREVWTECNESIAYCVAYVKQEAAERIAMEIQTQLEDVAYLVGKDGSESDRAMFRTVHADNTGALEMLRAGELDAANLVQGGWVTPAAPVADHTIPMVPADAREASDGITHKSQYVYQTSKSSYPTRIVRWSNVGRPNPRNGQPVRFGEVGPIDGGDGQYLDPSNRATDNPVTILVDPEDITIDNYGTGTGTVGSGQVYAPNGEILRPGETVTLTYGDDTSGPYPVRFTGNGHGYVEI